MKITNNNNEMLLQNGIHEGEILDFEIDITLSEVRIVVGFLESKVILHYTMDYKDPEKRSGINSELASLMFEDSLDDIFIERLTDELPELKWREVIGDKCRFKVDLLAIKTAIGFVGINVISGMGDESEVGDEELVLGG